jgi:alanyl-tRNA synthetase
MCTVLQQKESVFDTDIFRPIIDAIQKYIWLSYKGNERRFRIIADHIRTASILINDWVVQSNIGAGYVLRMIIRRMYYNLILLKDLSDQDLVWLISESVNFTATIREIKINEVIKSMLDEINTFKNTISRWLKVLHEKIDSSKWLLSWGDIFFLYDTCWFPLELTREICTEKHVKIDEDWFKKELESQKERSRQSAKFQKDIDRSKYLDLIPPTEFIGYDLSHYQNSLSSWDTNLSSSSVSEGFNEYNLLKDFEVNWQRVLIFDKTSFYAESGWQKWDSGIVELDTWEIVKIKDVQKYEWVFLHLVK